MGHHTLFSTGSISNKIFLFTSNALNWLLASNQTVEENYQGGLVLTPAWPLEKRGDEKDPSSRSRPDLQSAGGKQTWRERELERWMTRRGKKPVLDFPAR